MCHDITLESIQDNSPISVYTWKILKIRKFTNVGFGDDTHDGEDADKIDIDSILCSRCYSSDGSEANKD